MWRGYMRYLSGCVDRSAAGAAMGLWFVLMLMGCGASALVHDRTYEIRLSMNDEVLPSLTNASPSYETPSYNVTASLTADVCKPRIDVRSFLLRSWEPILPIASTGSPKCVLVPIQAFANEQYHYGKLCATLVACD